MSWLAAILVGVTTAVMAAVLLERATDISLWIVQTACRMVPREERAEMEEEWLAILVHTPGPATCLVRSLGFIPAAVALRGVPSARTAWGSWRAFVWSRVPVWTLILPSLLLALIALLLPPSTPLLPRVFVAIMCLASSLMVLLDVGWRIGVRLIDLRWPANKAIERCDQTLKVD